MHVSCPRRSAGRQPQQSSGRARSPPNAPGRPGSVRRMSAPEASAPQAFFDARPLVEPVDRATVRAYVRALRAAGRMPPLPVGRIVVAIVVGVFFLFVFGTTFTQIVVGLLLSGVGSAAAVGGTLVLLVVAGVVAALIWAFATGRIGSSGIRAYRLDRFAQANGMTWYAEIDDPPLPGMIFSLGHTRAATDAVRGTHPRFAEFGNFRYKTGSGKNESTHHWGYVAVRLSTPLPHIVLDARSNNGLFGSNLPASFATSQRLGLEGDFDQHFTLYCPAGYERDALYLFTPDIMARFIDQAAVLDVEIVDDWMFLYTRSLVSTLDSARWAWLFSVVGALSDKFAQWERWRDDRLAAPPAAVPVTDASATAAAPVPLLSPPPGVAPQGRRLRRRFSWIGLLLAVLFFGVWIYAQAVDMFGSP